MHSFHPQLIHEFVKDRERHLRSTSVRLHRQSIRGQRRARKRR